MGSVGSWIHTASDVNTVAGHGCSSYVLQEVDANIDPITIDSLRSYVSDVHGKPAKTHLKVFAQLAAPGSCLLSPHPRRDACSAFAIRIRTGRRHQIRAHLLHSGHPTVVDCKYAAQKVSAYRLAAYEQAYIRTRCPD